MMIGAPSSLRDELVVLTKGKLVNRCLGLRPERVAMRQIGLRALTTVQHCRQTR
jgi:transposase